MVITFLNGLLLQIFLIFTPRRYPPGGGSHVALITPSPFPQPHARLIPVRELDAGGPEGRTDGVDRVLNTAGLPAFRLFDGQ
jgi:hypothetical protein